jgi:hypothetical protein
VPVTAAESLKIDIPPMVPPVGETLNQRAKEQ